jgi:hypothetical protein
MKSSRVKADRINAPSQLPNSGTPGGKVNQQFEQIDGGAGSGGSDNTPVFMRGLLAVVPCWGRRLRFV